jgi:hypothetical protein
MGSTANSFKCNGLGDGVLLGARVVGLCFFEDVEFVVGNCLGCGKSWAKCRGELMDVNEYAA